MRCSKCGIESTSGAPASENLEGERKTVTALFADWFTEGFDTADLKDAKALLDELAS